MRGGTTVSDRVPVDVAVGVLIDADGRFLLTSRPEGKVYAGYWEFPGGKLEAGETVEQALRRELHEELGITIGAAHPWKIELMDYPHARVRLHFCKVYDWQGAFDDLADVARVVYLPRTEGVSTTEIITAIRDDEG